MWQNAIGGFVKMAMRKASYFSHGLPVKLAIHIV
jgi:hypothetical protein